MPEHDFTPRPAPDHPAVALCLLAYRLAHEACLQGKGELAKFNAPSQGDEAFRRAMPPLDGKENIRGFIACVAHGMLIGSVNNADAARLLYAAQVAQDAVEKPAQRSPGRPRTISAEPIPLDTPLDPPPANEDTSVSGARR